MPRLAICARRRRPCARALALAGGLALGAGTAAAEPVQLDLRGNLPCAGDELRAALTLRQGLTGRDVTIAATIDDGGDDRLGTVVVRVGDRQRVVDVGDARGDDAARVIAVVVLDLTPSPSPASPPSAAPLPVAVPGDVNVSAPVAVIAARPRWTASARAELALDRVGAALELTHAVAAELDVRASVGADLPASDTAMTTTVDRDDLTLRLGAGYHLPAVPSLTASLSALGRVERASSVTSSTELLLGATATLGYALHLGSRRRSGPFVGFTLGIDAMLTGRTYRVDDVTVSETQRLGAWAGVGVGYEGWR